MNNWQPASFGRSKWLMLFEKSVAAMSMKEMGFKLLELITSNQADEEQMRTILIFVINLLSAPIKPPGKPSA